MVKLTHALTQIQITSIDIDLINSFKFLQKALLFPLGAGTFGMFYIYITYIEILVIVSLELHAG